MQRCAELETFTANEILGFFWNGYTPVNTVNIAKKMGIYVKGEQDLEDGAVSKIQLLDTGAVLISFSLTANRLRKRFAIAHEIGHYALGHLSPTNRTFIDPGKNFQEHQSSDEEHAANHFALRLLMPPRIVRYVITEKGITRLDKLAKLFGVSTLAMTYGLKKAGIL